MKSRPKDTSRKTAAKNESANTMWGGRFELPPSELMHQINNSIDFDKRLYYEDIYASKAHAQMLMAQNILTNSDAQMILKGLDTILSEIEQDKFVFSNDLEDIHMNIEGRLTELIGRTAGRLHTGRSRNDQVATDFRLWVRRALQRTNEEMRALQSALIQCAAEHVETVMPGFTHLQSAQPVTLGHHLLAYVEMLGRDRSRTQDCISRLNECPLGAAALAGTSFDIDRHASAKALGFDRPSANSIDAVSDRDFALEAVSVASISAIHLSRLAEELVLWSSAHFNFIQLSDNFSTGSSIMPQKRNPDAAELVRAKAGRIGGSFVTLMTMIKGLALSYSKDLQEDKEPVFDAFDSLSLCLRAMSGMINDMVVNKEAMYEAAGYGFSTATELADWLVQKLNMPFREAHQLTGAVVNRCEELECTLENISLKELQLLDSRITMAALDVLSTQNAVKNRSSYGGTAPKQVRKQIKLAQERFL